LQQIWSVQVAFAFDNDVIIVLVELQ